jgi:RNA polymerase sigma-70 factor, ECF subfamily
MILADTSLESRETLRMEEGQATDQALIAAANRGEFTAFEELYRRHRDWVAQIAFRFTHDEDIALDVVQEVFLYFLKKFPGFELRCELKTFLYPAARNVAISLRRKTERYVSDEESIANVPSETTAPQSDILTAVLAGLPEQQREVLLLRFGDGLALNEIAIALEIPLGTVKSRLHNALATLEKDPRTKTFFA